MAQKIEENKKQTKRQKPEKKKKMEVPRTVQQSIPYESVYPNGIIQTGANRYSRSYHLEDTNFTIAGQREQEDMFLDYEGLLNSIDSSMTAQITVFNRSVEMEVVRNRILLHPKPDDANGYRDELNSVILDKMAEGRNNLSKEKYLTISVDAMNIEEAFRIFKRLDSDVNSKISRINKKDTPPMTLEERLGILYDIYNDNVSFPFRGKIGPLLRGDKLDLASLNGAGLSTKDLIGPESFFFSASSFNVGGMFCRSFFLDNLPTILNSNILTDLSDLPCNMLTSIVYNPIPDAEAANMVKHQITNVNENIIRAQKRAARGNYSTEIIPNEMKRAQAQAEMLRSDMQSRNQKLFKVSVIITLLCNSEEELQQNTDALKAVGITYQAQVKTLTFQQEAGFNTSLPLARMDINIDRVLNTESSACFMPFSVEEMSQEHGIYYGQHAVSKNLILYDRMTGDNYNGMILGKPGSGKSFIAKSEIAGVFLGTVDDIIIIDPQGEYKALAKAFNGEVIRIAIGSETHINPLDMDVQYAGENEDPIAMKCDFLTALCGTIVGQGALSPIMVNVIHKTGRRIYRPYYEHMRNVVMMRDANGNRITCDRQAMPTLVDFYQDLISQDDANAQMLASAIEMYCVGNYDIFAKQTNVDPTSRLIVYDISDVGTGMKEMALQICMNDVWNRIIENHKKKKITRFYIDEFQHLLKTRSSALFTLQIWQMARKWGGSPTGITQNVDHILNSDEARLILSNSNFLLMLNQSPIDRAELANMFSISDKLQEYITDKPAGTGLMYTGSGSVIPFINQFPKDTSLYKLMSTKATEKDVVL